MGYGLFSFGNHRDLEPDSEPHQAIVSTMKLWIYSALSLSMCSAKAAPAPDTQELSVKNYRAWMNYIRPSGDELKWRKIAWRNKLMPAVDEARKLNRPVLLWAMNGNPCGET